MHASTLPTGSRRTCRGARAITSGRVLWICGDGFLVFPTANSQQENNRFPPISYANSIDHCRPAVAPGASTLPRAHPSPREGIHNIIYCCVISIIVYVFRSLFISLCGVSFSRLFYEFIKIAVHQ